MTDLTSSAVNPFRERAVEELRALLRIDSTNPPMQGFGAESEAARLIGSWLQEEQIDFRILEKQSGRGNLVARIKGDGSLPPLLLAGHLDVVAAERDKWSHPPFGAEVHEGYLYGRGAIDMKNFLVMATCVLRALKREGALLKRDVILAAVADEEAGCDFGSKFLVEEHAELVRAEYMIGEVGGFSMYLGDQCVYPVMVAEKGVAWLEATFDGEPGHGSVPKPNTSILKLADWTLRLAKTRLPHHVTDPAKLLIESLARAQGGGAKWVLPRLLNASLADIVLDKLFPDKALSPWFDALLRNTATPTVLRAGEKVNVIPGTATLQLDGRTLPGFSAADLIHELEAALGHGVHFKVLREMPAVTVTEHTPLFSAVRETLAQHAPSAVVVPYMIPGFTDAKQFSRLGTKCYGFAPLRFPKAHDIQFGKLYHGHDERIWIEGFQWGISVLYDVIKRFAAYP